MSKYFAYSPVLVVRELSREKQSKHIDIKDLLFVWISVLKPFRQDLPITHLRSIKDFQQVRMGKS